MIKAIETTYRGYRFRSRLEARWAVFFDALGLKWEYEPEGFDLGEAGWYLPDFRIFADGTVPRGPLRNEVWFDVKPSNCSSKDTLKLEAFALLAKTCVVCLNGEPDFDRTFLAFLGGATLGPGDVDTPCFMLDTVVIAHPDINKWLWYEFHPLVHGTWDPDFKLPPLPPQVIAARDAARSARFGKGGRG